MSWNTVLSAFKATFEQRGFRRRKNTDYILIAWFSTSTELLINALMKELKPLAMEVQEFENGQSYKLLTNFTLADCLDSDGRKNIDAFVIALFFPKKNADSDCDGKIQARSMEKMNPKKDKLIKKAFIGIFLSS